MPLSSLSSSQYLHHEANMLKKAKGASIEITVNNYSEFFVKQVNSKTPPESCDEYSTTCILPGVYFR
jgi:hypothetical protein